ncbi:hypothetical protein EUGRSUZ_E01320 [Eucalyptus grandis]|uniref:Uncharacterized protein n=2 Tax=Eucalyptus grandis TaxID=71139 RepID=A0ACC3KUX3_EUCGR|nr:hypothetical protein EUGRSUZ_E01320 [Eucalyptus grandis]
MNDAGGKPVLCACIDNTVHMYELPSFNERGKIFSRREVMTLQTAPGGLFFTGDAEGILTVWNWLDFPKSQRELLPHSMESCSVEERIDQAIDIGVQISCGRQCLLCHDATGCDSKQETGWLLLLLSAPHCRFCIDINTVCI